MQELTIVTGMILKTVPIGDYDRRVCLLTKERGKISAFVKGARRQNSRFMATTDVFCFGQFKLYEGRTSYNIMEADISNYFEALRDDFEGAYYGMYFMEIADYYTRENSDATQMLLLLYQSLRALYHTAIKRELVRYIFEIKAMVIEGEFPGAPAESGYNDSTLYAIEHIRSSTIGKLYTFTVTETVLGELKQLCGEYRAKVFDRKFKSLEILEGLL